MYGWDNVCKTILNTFKWQKTDVNMILKKKSRSAKYSVHKKKKKSKMGAAR